MGRETGKSKTVDAWIEKHPGVVKDYGYEGGNGYNAWYANLEDGWRCVLSDSHTCVEESLVDFVEALNSTEICFCEDCDPKVQKILDEQFADYLKEE